MAKKKTIKIEEPVELKKAPLLRNNVPDPIPSVLSGLLRFSPDHIVRLIYDPDSKNFLLGDLTQNLVTEGVMGESGGSSLNPVINVTIKPSGDAAEFFNEAVIDGANNQCIPTLDGNAYAPDSIDLTHIDADGTGTAKWCIALSKHGDNYEANFRPADIIYSASEMQNTAITADNAVNCSLNNMGVIEIIDITTEASVTLKVVFSN